MAFKFVVALAFVAVASAGLLPAAQVYHSAPFVHSAPVYHSAPVVHSAPLVHSAPAYQASPVYHSAPVVHSAPLLHSAPAYQAAPVYHSAPVLKTVAQPILAKNVEEYDPHPQYNYGYDVQDALTGDNKRQVESRDGDVVHGEYSLNDADGYRRTVQYTADPINGFNAVVHREPLTKVIAAAPIVKSAPLAYAAPALAYHH